MFHWCLVEYFVEPDKFCICWGRIQQRKFFMERKAEAIIADVSVASSLQTSSRRTHTSKYMFCSVRKFVSIHNKKKTNLNLLLKPMVAQSPVTRF